MIMVRIDLMALWLNEERAQRRGNRRGNGKGYDPQGKGGKGKCDEPQGEGGKGKGYESQGIGEKGKCHEPQGNGEEDRMRGQTAGSSNDAVQPEPGGRWMWQYDQKPCTLANEALGALHDATIEPHSRQRFTVCTCVVSSAMSHTAEPPPVWIMFKAARPQVHSKCDCLGTADAPSRAVEGNGDISEAQARKDISQIPLGSEGMRHIACLIVNFVGWPEGEVQLRRAATGTHAWTHNRFDDRHGNNNTRL